MSTPRRRSREAALQAEFARRHTEDDLDEVITNLGASGEPEVRPQDEFSMRLLTTLERHEEEIDQAIASVLKKWTAERLGGADRALIRLGAAELLYFDDVPPRAAINEYIELAKLYGDSESPRFLNGVLDAIRKTKPSSREEPAGGRS